MKYWWKPYEALMETKPVPAIDVVVKMIAEEAAEICLHFPPPESEVEWSDMRLKRKLSMKLHELPKMNIDLVRLIAKLLVWDLRHEIEAIDHFFRNELHREVADTAGKVDALHFLWRGIMEMLSTRKEESKQLLKAKHLVDVAEQMPEQFLKLQRRMN